MGITWLEKGCAGSQLALHPFGAQKISIYLTVRENSDVDSLFAPLLVDQPTALATGCRPSNMLQNPGPRGCPSLKDDPAPERRRTTTRSAAAPLPTHRMGWGGKDRPVGRRLGDALSSSSDETPADSGPEAAMK